MSMRVHYSMQVIGWENIELISDRPLDVMLGEFRRLKMEFPDRCCEPCSAAPCCQPCMQSIHVWL